MRDILIEFRDNINSRGTISQNDILSLETMIQENIITDQKSINFFTKDSTTVGVQDVNDILDKKIEETKVNNVMTTQEFLDSCRDIIYKINMIKSYIFENIVAIPSEVIDFINNPTYEKLYVKNIETSNLDLVDIKDELLVDLFITNNPFRTKLFEVLGTKEDVIDSFESGIKGNGIDRETCTYFPLLSELMNESIEPLTFKFLLRVKDKISVIEEKMNEDLEFYKGYDSFKKVNEYLSGDDVYIKNLINKIKTDITKYDSLAKPFTFIEYLGNLLKNKK